jgi:hypothetical protein
VVVNNAFVPLHSFHHRTVQYHDEQRRCGRSRRNYLQGPRNVSKPANLWELTKRNFGELEQEELQLIGLVMVRVRAKRIQANLSKGYPKAGSNQFMPRGIPEDCKDILHGLAGDTSTSPTIERHLIAIPSLTQV